MTVPVLMPRPSVVTWTGELFELTESTRVAAPPAIASLLRELLGGPTGLPLAAGDASVVFDLTADADAGAAADADVGLGGEGYRLTVDASGVRARAASEQGLRWAAQTLRQLLPHEAYAIRPARGIAWTLPGVRIEDRPRLPWRGALLDVARWYQPLPSLFQFVDLLALHKLNVLHLHLTDDQGWRFETRKYPRLTEVGAFRRESVVGREGQERLDGRKHGGFYQQRDLKALVAYGQRRGVRIMPEIDMPGHVQAAISAYPHLGNDPERQLQVRSAWRFSPHVLNAEDSTLAFMRDVLDEVVDVFPGEYVHLGGDEVPLDEWQASPRARARIRELGLGGAAGLPGWWIARMSEHLAAHGRKAAAWDEVVDAHPPRDTLIFAWQSQARVHAALDAGHQVVAVPEEYVYFDYAQTGSPDEPVANDGTPVTLSRVYGYDPVPAGAAGRVLGTQGMLWCEHLPTPRLVQWRAFPRLTAIAEITWSSGRDEEGFLAGLPAHTRRLDQMGVTHNPLE